MLHLLSTIAFSHSLTTFISFKVDHRCVSPLEIVVG